MAGSLGPTFTGTPSGDIRQDVESQSTAAVPVAVSSASRRWKQARNIAREGGSGDVGGRGNDGGFGGYGGVEVDVDEGEPLLCEEVKYVLCFRREGLHRLYSMTSTRMY